MTSFDHTSTTKVAVLGNYRQMGGKSSVRAGIFFAGDFLPSLLPFETYRFIAFLVGSPAAGPCSTKEEEEEENWTFAMSAAMDKGISNSQKRKNRFIKAPSSPSTKSSGSRALESGPPGGATPGIDFRNCPRRLTNLRTDLALVKSRAPSQFSACLQDGVNQFPGTDRFWKSYPCLDRKSVV